jgi:hypothetical protein
LGKIAFFMTPMDGQFHGRAFPAGESMAFAEHLWTSEKAFDAVEKRAR